MQSLNINRKKKLSGYTLPQIEDSPTLKISLINWTQEAWMKYIKIYLVSSTKYIQVTCTNICACHVLEYFKMKTSPKVDYMNFSKMSNIN